MPQYTSTFTSPFDGTITNSVLDTVTNKTTITVTAPGGQTASVTVDPDLANPNGPYAYNTDFVISNLSRQLNEQGADLGLRGITSGVVNTTTNVTQQNEGATTTARVTGNPPPAESQPIPTNSEEDPAVPAPEPDPELPVADELAEPPDPDPGEYDEFAGLDAAVAANENALEEPPQLSDDEVNDYLNNIPAPEDEEPAPDTESPTPTARGISSPLFDTRSSATNQDSNNAKSNSDWRVRLSLAPSAKYLYAGPNPGILTPLIKTKGVLFPYTPTIQVAYNASYDSSELTHSNYKVFQYKGSNVENISITCDFTAQDTFEANYMLAVIHFFRSVTKMFYGQDQNPINGTPPPLCYLTGMGAFQFDAHPLAVTGFTYNLPNDVDYIQADNAAVTPGQNREQEGYNVPGKWGEGIAPGGTPPAAKFNYAPTGTVEPTYVPTKIQLSISAIPIISRNDISNNWSLRDYGSGELLRGSKRNGAGIW